MTTNNNRFMAGDQARIRGRSILGGHEPPEMIHAGDVVIILEPEMLLNKTRIMTADGKIGWFFSDELILIQAV